MKAFEAAALSRSETRGKCKFHALFSLFFPCRGFKARPNFFNEKQVNLWYIDVI